MLSTTHEAIRTSGVPKNAPGSCYEEANLHYGQRCKFVFTLLCRFRKHVPGIGPFVGFRPLDVVIPGHDAWAVANMQTSFHWVIADDGVLT